MTLYEIIDLLKISGDSTKTKVLRMIEKASIKELLELRESISEIIRIKAME